jgi:hypothetical protein
VEIDGFECAVFGSTETHCSNSFLNNNSIGIDTIAARNLVVHPYMNSVIANNANGNCGIFANNFPVENKHLTIHGYRRGLIIENGGSVLSYSIFTYNIIDVIFDTTLAMTLTINKTRLQNTIITFQDSVILLNNCPNIHVDYIDTENGDFRLRSKFSGYEIESDLLYFSDTSITFNGVTHYADIGAYLVARCIMQDRWMSFIIREPFDAPQYTQTPAESSNNINRNGLNRTFSRGRKEVVEFIWDTMSQASRDFILDMFDIEYQRENSGKVRIYFNIPDNKSFRNFKLDLTRDVLYKKRVNWRALTYHDGIGFAVREYDN